ncbi:serpin A3-4-like [Hetaerina americana]|uniref:serpin A3-4-like n=1 Tax=Hetaerina americana TaxID=62018 RepID=UPI003A7F4CD2
MATSRLPLLPPLLVLVTLASSASSPVAEQPVAREAQAPWVSSVTETHHIAFPGSDAFSQISGRPRKNGTAPAGARPQYPAAPASGASFFRPECPTAKWPEYAWSNQSPFLNPSDGRPPLDVRLAVDAMFRLSSSLESQLRDPSATNLLLSPLGLASALGQLMLAARGRTADQLATLLTGSTQADCNFHMSFRAVLAQVWSRRGSESHELSVGNALFHQRGSPALNGPFLAHLAADYAGETFPVDFRGDPLSAQQQINQWALRASKGQIEQLMPILPPRTTTAIISSVTHFKAMWENQFNKQFTTRGTFYIDGDYTGRTKMADFMSGEFEVPYAESKSLGCKMVVLPYTNNETAMYLIMPLGPSKWKGPRPLPPLLIAHRDKNEDSISTRSALADPDIPRPLPLYSAYPTTHGQQTSYNVENERGARPITTRFPYGTASQQPYGHSQQKASNPQRLRRRQTPQQEASHGFHPSHCQGHVCKRAPARSPFSATKLHQLAHQLQAEQFNALVASATLMRVSLFIPKLSMTSNVKLKDALSTLGVTDIFGDDSDLSGAVNQTVGGRGTRWAINEVWQQSRLNVNEEGTEATSGTVAVIVDYSLDSAIFKANSPFLAIIRHEVTGTPIFWASVADPS